MKCSPADTRGRPEPCSNTPYDAASVISKNTNRLNRSAVRKVPASPMSWNWNSGWKCTPARCQRAAANSTAASATMPVSTSIIADRRSLTSTMPNGAGQLPGRYAHGPGCMPGASECARSSQPQQGGADIERRFDALVLLGQQQHHGGREQGQRDRCQDQVRHQQRGDGGGQTR